MKKRVITGAVLVAIAVPILIFSKYIVYPLFLSALSLVAMVELFRCIGLSDKYHLSVPASVFAAAMPTLIYLIGNDALMTSLTVGIIASFALLFYYFGAAVCAKGELRFETVASAFALTVYVTSGFSALSALRYIPLGGYCIALIFFASWICDTFAYFFGSRFGKHKLIPEVSPKKSVEGSVAGIVSSALVSALYGLIIDLVTEGVTVNYVTLVISGLVLSVVSQFGDLIASLIKREHGIKDYGRIFPGHGGVMDRFDSMLAVALPLLLICIAFPPFS